MSKHQRYSPAFRAEAVTWVLEPGLSPEVAAKRLSIPTGTLGKGSVAAQQGAEKPDTVAPGSRSVMVLETEHAGLRKEWAQTRRERDVLTTATAYFAKESLPGARF
jgi:transposase